ncbi:inter-alpha-trypsin inhibitor heavy chain H3-like isoform X2 [Lineus longissimus]|uniref:inter-alpha-trypsin inhibitor heavy chain H3-like isoform X2 n=1 Tax=Lineus longissimus TaxID=88925 RepID=UPI00315D29B2
MWRLLVILLISAAGVFGQVDDVNEEDTDAQAPAPPEIRYLHIESKIAFRFSTTRVSSMLVNVDDKPREAIFTIQLPKSAFITTFSMTIEGVTYDGTVKEKAAALREYIEAKKQGQSAGHIAAKPRNTNAFEVSVNVASQQKVTFNLTYQELLQRTLAMYQNVMYINPGQIVPDLKVDVFINESREITILRVPALQKNVQDTMNTFQANQHATVTKISQTSAHVSFSPSEALQKEMSAKGISSQFVVQYDVQRGYDAGDLQVVDGYFVHFIAPVGLPAVKKNVLFILDISGSMSGKKLAQTKDAMRVILRDLQPGDLFNIFLFDDRIRRWNATHLVAVDDNSLRVAQEYIKNMSARGSTDINRALTKGIEFLDNQRQQEKPMNPSSLIVFLTDGDPTSGVTNIDRILSNVREANEDSGHSIFSLGFGRGVDFGFLRKISLQNNGIARKIYEESDAALQLQGFYKEISTPLLTDLKVEYLDVENTTRVEFPNYFNGSEIVICGIFEPDIIDIDDDDLPDEPIFRTKVRGKSNGNDVIIEKEVDVKDASNTGLRASTERLWAYLTIRELLDKMEKTDDDDDKAELKSKALRLSLKYSFVTPLTSMIVKKPNANDSRSDISDSDDPIERAVSSRGRGAQFSPGVFGNPPPQGLSGGNHGARRKNHHSMVDPSFDLQTDDVGMDPSGAMVPADRCNPKCQHGFVCKLTQVQCVRAPCPSSRQCVAFRNTTLLQNSYVMLQGVDGPRILVNISGVKFCQDPQVLEGESLVVKEDGRSGAQVNATFTTVGGETVMTGVKVVLPQKNLTMTADLVKMDIMCHGTPESRNWQDLFGTNQALVMPGVNQGGQSRQSGGGGHRGRGGSQGRRGGHHGRGQGRGTVNMHHGRRTNAWAKMESHQLRIHISRKLCLLVTRNTDLQTDYLSLRLEVQRTGEAPQLEGIMGNYLTGRVNRNGVFQMKDHRGRMQPLFDLANHVPSLPFPNPFSLVDDTCKFY